jgi:N-acetylglucosamine kinase-like BadF-type ATPase
MGVIVGVDGGGSNTVVGVADADGRLLRTSRWGPSNPYAIGVETAGATLSEAIAGALRSEDRAPDDVMAIAVGLAGVEASTASDAIRDQLIRMFPGARCLVVNDAELVLTAGTPVGVGVAVISGTGSIAIGRDAAGRHGRAGGWGRILGDEGSGYHVGVAGLRAASNALEARGEPTALVDLLLARLGVHSVPELVQRVQQLSPVEVASLAPVVATAASAGDRIAGVILTEAAADLAGAVRAVISQLEWAEPIPLALGGGLLCNWTRLREQCLEALRIDELNLGPIECVPDPAVGAVLLARRLLEGPPVNVGDRRANRP